MVTIKDLEAFFGDGWNRHDVNFLMTFMSDDCVFESTAGPEVCGTRYAGPERVREAFARVFSIFPDANFAGARHFVAGNRGASEWTFTGTTADGKKVEVNGCDIFTRSPSRARTSRTVTREAAGREAEPSGRGASADGVRGAGPPPLHAVAPGVAA